MYGILLDKINKDKPEIFGKMTGELVHFLSFLQSQAALVRSYRFVHGESRVDNYIP